MNFIKLIINPKPYVLEAKRRVINSFRKWFYRGTSVHCTVCKWNGKHFFNTTCPNCNSLARTRLIPYAINYFNIDNNSNRVLHVAPNALELGTIKSILNNTKVYDCLDIQPKKFVNLVQDLTQTTIQDDTYDFILVWHVFEHIVNDKKAIQEVHRLLKPGGKLLVSVPIYPKGNLTTFEDEAVPREHYGEIHGHPDHCRSCGMDYYLRFQEVGFKVDTLKIAEEEPNTVSKLGLSTAHVVWCFTK